ncbi:MAG TPA: anaerobic ribonucleoside-triphosphate reductase activating protein [Clostridiaceae bacterium]|nr:anaerobic ribonucleoside-triphosphate reductase activating protein [Clostridiaceae bacterium]
MNIYPEDRIFKESYIRIAGVVPESSVDGPGLRYVVFVQGCCHLCDGCHNPETHDFYAGKVTDLWTHVLELRSNKLLRGLTLSGGEPFLQPRPLALLAAEAKRLGHDVICYSGYTYEKLRQASDLGQNVGELLREIDILIDGPYIASLKDSSLSFRGSSNQRILKIKDGYMTDCLEELI